MTEFDGIVPALAAALAERGYAEATPVQRAMIDPSLAAADLLVSAQTGSGKTVAFGIALAPTLLGEAPGFGPAEAPLALVVAPTRELALQVRRELDWLYAGTHAILASAVGGMDMRTEVRALARGAHILVGTPGRICDHIKRGSLDMGGLRAVVLDEADEMLDLGFREDLEFILDQAPPERRTLMFSATVPKPIAALAATYQKDARRLAVAGEARQHADIEYRALTCAKHERENAIINVLRYYEAPTALVFCATRAAVGHMTARFANRGFSVVALSGELSQAERTHALQAMRDGRARVCIATDVAARGIDLPGLELVVHADLPANRETLLHRSGRTGRAGRKGVSALIVSASDRRKAERLLAAASIHAVWADPPSAEAVLARDAERLLASPLLDGPITDDEAALVARLVKGHAADTLAAAFLRLAREGRSAPEDLTPEAAPRGRPNDVASRPVSRSHDAFADSGWIALSVGRAERAEARWLLPMLCAAGGMTKDAIGAIRVQEHETLVQLAGASLDGFMARVGPSQTLEKGIRVRRAESGSDTRPAPRPDPSREPRAEPPAEGAAPTPTAAPERPAPAPRRQRPEGFDAADPGASLRKKPAKPPFRKAAGSPKPAGKPPFRKPAGTPAGKPTSKPGARPASAAKPPYKPRAKASAKPPSARPKGRP